MVAICKIIIIAATILLHMTATFANNLGKIRLAQKDLTQEEMNVVQDGKKEKNICRFFSSQLLPNIQDRCTRNDGQIMRCFSVRDR